MMHLSLYIGKHPNQHACLAYAHETTTATTTSTITYNLRAASDTDNTPTAVASDSMSVIFEHPRHVFDIESSMERSARFAAELLGLSFPGELFFLQHYFASGARRGAAAAATVLLPSPQETLRVFRHRDVNVGRHTLSPTKAVCRTRLTLVREGRPSKREEGNKREQVHRLQ